MFWGHTVWIEPESTTCLLLASCVTLGKASVSPSIRWG